MTRVTTGVRMRERPPNEDHRKASGVWMTERDHRRLDEGETTGVRMRERQHE